MPNAIAAETTPSHTPRIEDTWKYPQNQPNDQRLGMENYLVTKTLHYKELLAGDAAPPARTWTYQFPQHGVPEGYIDGPDGGRQWNYFHTDSNCPAGVSFGCANLKYKTVLPEGTPIEQYWQANEPWIRTSSNWDRKNAYVRAEYRTPSGGMASAAVFAYDKNGNFTDNAEYDWMAAVLRSNGIASGIPDGSHTPKLVTEHTYFYATAAASAIPESTQVNAYWTKYYLDAETVPFLVKGAATRTVDGG